MPISFMLPHKVDSGTVPAVPANVLQDGRFRPENRNAERYQMNNRFKDFEFRLNRLRRQMIRAFAQAMRSRSANVTSGGLDSAATFCTQFVRQWRLPEAGRDARL
jgi:hypothetical protein